VIGGALVDASPKATATLDLQNGPDAIRIRWPDGAAEVVGYGALEFPEYFCGEPAVDVPAGQSLARLPDDADLGSNALDFRAAAPSPGRANQRRRDAALVSGTLAIDPELPEPGAVARLSVTVENRGIDPISAVDLTVVVREADAAPLASAALPVALAAAETASVALELPPLATGVHRLCAAVALAGDETPENDADSLWVRIGRGALQLREVQFHPERGEGEWVEVVNAGITPLDLGGYALTDRGAHPARVAASSPLSPESLAVLAQDRSALLARFPGLDSTRVVEARPWPSLNNSDDDSGVADVVRLVETGGILTDRLAYSSAGIPAGWTLEENAGNWGVGAAPGGSPLAFPCPPRALPRRFDVEPRRVARGKPARLAWDLPWPRARVAFELYDLAGRSRGVVLEEAAVAARGERTWIPGGVDAGLYLVVMRARPERGEGALAVARPLRVEAP
jgi:hypothetical protein